MRTRLSILLLALSFSIASGCNKEGTTELDLSLKALIEDIIMCTMLEKQIPGLSVSIVRNGSAIYQEAFGKADIVKNADVKVDTPFAIASVTKIFTTFSVLQLIEQGLASLDDQLGEHLPNLQNDGWKTRTIRDLLSMSSGIPDLALCNGGSKDGEVCEPPPFTFNPCGEDSECKGVNRMPFKEYLERLSVAALQFDGGAQYFYSDANFLILGELIEALSGMSYEDYVKENVLEPLGMTNTEPNTVPPLVIEGLAAPYRHISGNPGPDAFKCITFDDPPDNCSTEPTPGVMCEEISVEERRLPLQSFSSGWLVTTQPDMVKLEQALHALSPTLLSKASYDEMWTNTELNHGVFERFGLGWDVCSELDPGCPKPVDPLAGGIIIDDELAADTPVTEGKVVIKDGGLQGYMSVIVRYLDDGLTVIIFYNTRDVAPGPLSFHPVELAAELADTVRAN